MRLFLIPISTRRTLIYGHRLTRPAQEQPTYLDKITVKASEQWLKWEKMEGGWQKWLTINGNKLLSQISYEEWGLKSIPAISTRSSLPDLDTRPVEVVFPPSILSRTEIPSIVRHLTLEKRAHHKRLLIWSAIGMPIVAPFGLVPIIPNIPFFYLAYRAYSHKKAISGIDHVADLMKKDLLLPTESLLLDQIYGSVDRKAIPDLGKILEESKVEWKDARSVDNGEEAEALLLRKEDVQTIEKVLEVPGLAVECERAVDQVEKILSTEAEKTAQKIRIDEVKKKEE